MRQASLTVAACAAVLWSAAALATPTPQQQCDFARIMAWRAYVLCVDGVLARDAKGVFAGSEASWKEFDWLRSCRHTYFDKWATFQSTASLAGSTCIGSRFTDNGDGTVTDHLTGLVWEQKTTNITEYPIPTVDSGPQRITAGPDGNLWFTENSANQIGKVATDGQFTEYTIPTPGSGPWDITAGPDGNLWFTENSANQIGKVTTDGQFTEYTIPTAGSGPLVITVGPNGNLWFTEYFGNLEDRFAPEHFGNIGEVTTDGQFTEYPVPMTNGSWYNKPVGITAGPDGNLWYTAQVWYDTSFFLGNNVGKVTTDGQFTKYTIPQGSEAVMITAGPDGNLWFTENGSLKIGKMTPAGVFSEYLANGAWTRDLGFGPDGNLWFPEPEADQIGKMTTDGVVTESPIPRWSGRPWGIRPLGITAGPDGNLWFTENLGNNIGMLQADAPLGPHFLGNRYSWSTLAPSAENGTAFSDFLTSLNAGGGFAGANGWRMPTIAELQTILPDIACPERKFGPTCNCGTPPCIDPTLGLTMAGAYWSATNCNPNYAWVVLFDGGFDPWWAPSGPVVNRGKTGSYDVRAVRGGL